MIRENIKAYIRSLVFIVSSFLILTSGIILFEASFVNTAQATQKHIKPVYPKKKSQKIQKSKSTKLNFQKKPLTLKKVNNLKLSNTKNIHVSKKAANQLETAHKLSKNSSSKVKLNFQKALKNKNIKISKKNATKLSKKSSSLKKLLALKKNSSKVVTKDTRSYTQDLLKMKRLRGNTEISPGSRAYAEILGKAWVNGKNVKRFKLEHGGYGLTDNTRTFRLQYKPKDGIWKANFQENIFKAGRARGIQIKNVHMNITDMVAP